MANVVEQLQANAQELLTVDKPLSGIDVRRLEYARGVIDKVIEESKHLQAARIVIGGDGNLSVVKEEPPPEPIVAIDAEGGISLEAGERFSTMLKRWRTAQGLTVSQVVTRLPISEDSYRALENGATTKLPDDICQALATMMGIRPEECQRALDLDIDYPVRIYGPY